MSPMLSTFEQTLSQYLEQQVEPQLASVLGALADTCAQISALVGRGALAGILGQEGTHNVQGEAQKKLDVIANDSLLAMAQGLPAIAGVASEEMETVQACQNGAPYLLLFDPLDGSSNIDINVSIGTIFSVLPSPSAHRPVQEHDFLQAGRAQRLAGYAVYGPQTQLVFSIGQGVEVFTLDRQTGQWWHTQSQVRIAVQTQEFAINMSNMRHWAAPVRQYIQDCLAGDTGPRGKNFNMRWVAAMVAEVHRILQRGGIFMYPWDAREPNKPGKLRLMYEANPMSFLIEQAGGQAVASTQAILDTPPTQLHQRISVILGAAEEVETVVGYFNNSPAH